MTEEYFFGFNDAIKGLYKNPYNDKTEMSQFMQYHNGHNSGSYYNRVQFATTS